MLVQNKKILFNQMTRCNFLSRLSVDKIILSNNSHSTNSDKSCFSINCPSAWRERERESIFWERCPSLVEIRYRMWTLNGAHVEKREYMKLLTLYNIKRSSYFRLLVTQLFPNKSRNYNRLNKQPQIPEL